MIEYLATLILVEKDSTSLAQILKPAGYCLAALPLFLLGTSDAVMQYADIRVRNLLLLLSALYLLVAAIGFVQADVRFVLWVRRLLKMHRLYEYRRAFQVLFLTISVFLVARYLLREPGAGQVVEPPRAVQLLLMTSAIGTGSVYLLKFVSFHYTDLVLNGVWMRHSIVTWIELACVGLVGLATGVFFGGGRKDV